jgi:uncharacterized BrkB/YihY/UPF0761 family membrane protein
MLLETQIQQFIIYVALIVFLVISPLLNIICIPNLAKSGKGKWKYRALAIIIYVLLMILLFWSVFIYYN